jgi:putative transposase
MKAIADLANIVGTAAACRALAVPRASFYRQKRPPRRPAGSSRTTPVRSLSLQERQHVLDLLHSARLADKPPAEVYATLLDEGLYVCSIRTMYRILAAEHEVRERRNQLRHPQYKKPELLATRPNQVWSWDITKLLGPAKWTYFYLYVILDIFSRYVVGWMLASRENAHLAQRLIRQTIIRQDVVADQLVIHSDRGPAMKSHCVAQLLATLGVTKSHSRPHVSNDNPFSESQFKTMKYRPDFPDRFASQHDALQFCQGFFDWYNHEHYHSGIGMLTPAMVHYGTADAILDQRQRVLDTAHAEHPERFVNKRPRTMPGPTEVWINRPTPTPQTENHPAHTANGTISDVAAKNGLHISLLTNKIDSTRHLTPADYAHCNQKSLTHFDINREEEPVLPVPKTKLKEIQYTKLQRQLSQTR